MIPIPRALIPHFSLLGLGLTALAAPAAAAGSFPVAIEVHADRTAGTLRPFWSFFGCDEPNYAESLDGRKLMHELSELAPGHVYFRTHNLLTTGDGRPALKWGSTGVYTEDAHGRPVYNWTILDDIFDSYIARGVKPYVEVGFMPEALSTHPRPYRHHWKPGDPYGDIFTGWSYPPKDYAKWEELVYQWVNHCVERYGTDEVNTWYWEVWNEANTGYWHGTPAEFRKLHDYAAAGILRALPTARIGGPDSAGAGGPFTRDFIAHCLTGVNAATGKVGTPLDFVSFHAKGSPRFVAGHVQMGIARQLQTIDQGFAIAASYPQTKHKPIIIGESDPDGCGACTGPQLGYRNTSLYATYTAESIAREYELADRRGVNLAGAITWAFEFGDRPIFSGLRSLSTHGIDKPVLNVFRMLGKMSGRRVLVQSSGARTLDSILQHGVRGRPDVDALAAIEPHQLSILVWHYHDDDVAGPEAAVTLSIDGLPPSVLIARFAHYRVDQDHSNAYTAWLQMGSPAHPTPEQHQQLETAGGLGTYPAPPILDVEDGRASVSFSLPREAVSLLVLQWR